MCVHVLLSCGWEFEPRSSCLPSKFSNLRSHLSFINFYCFGLCSFVYQSLCGYVHMNAYVCEGQRHLFESPTAGITSTCIISIFCRNRKRSLGHLSPRSLDFVVEMKLLMPLLSRFSLDLEGKLFYIRKPRAVIIFPSENEWVFKMECLSIRENLVIV